MSIWNKSGLALALAFVFQVLLILWLVFAYPLPPLTDYANHLARMHIIWALPHDPDLARYYTVEWRIIPNLAMDLVVPPLISLVGLYAAAQIYLAATLVSIVTGAMALGRALFGRWTMAPLFGSAFVFSEMLLIGSLNYLLGIGLSLWALAAWISLEDNNPAVRIAAGAACVMALFVVHLFAVGLFGIGLLAWHLRAFATSPAPIGSRLVGFVLPGFAFLPALALLFAGPTSGLAVRLFWDFNGKISGLAFSVEAYSTWIAAALVLSIAIAMAVAWWRGWLRIHPVMPYLLALGIIVYLLMPRLLFDSYMADLRLPIALLFMLLACVDIEAPDKAAACAAGLAALVMFVRIAEVNTNWSARSQESASVQRALANLTRGARLLTVTADSSRGYVPDDYNLEHIASLASIDRSALTTRTFTVRGKQVLQVREPYRNHVDQLDGSAPDLPMFLRYKDSNSKDAYIYWHHWPQRFDFVLVIYSDDSFQNPDPDALKLVAKGQRFQLYACRRVSP